MPSLSASRLLPRSLPAVVGACCSVMITVGLARAGDLIDSREPVPHTIGSSARARMGASGTMPNPRGTRGDKLPKYASDRVLVRFRRGVPEQAMASAHAAVKSALMRRFRSVERLHLVRLPAGRAVEEAAQAYRRSLKVGTRIMLPGSVLLWCFSKFASRPFLDQAFPNHSDHDNQSESPHPGQSGRGVDAQLKSCESTSLGREP